MSKPRVLVATSRYYSEITLELEAGANEVLEAADAEVETIEVPGALEVPGVIAMAADSAKYDGCLLYTSPSPRDRTRSRMPSSA